MKELLSFQVFLFLFLVLGPMTMIAKGIFIARIKATAWEFYEKIGRPHAMLRDSMASNVYKRWKIFRTLDGWTRAWFYVYEGLWILLMGTLLMLAVRDLAFR